MITPNLITLGGDLNLAGNKYWSENSFPVLEYVGGNLIISDNNFKKLPVNLKWIKGNVIISKNDPVSLLEDVKKAKNSGIIFGEIFLSESTYR